VESLQWDVRGRMHTFHGLHCTALKYFYHDSCNMHAKRAIHMEKQSSEIPGFKSSSTLECPQVVLNLNPYLTNATTDFISKFYYHNSFRLLSAVCCASPPHQSSKQKTQQCIITPEVAPDTLPAISWPTEQLLLVSQRA